MVEDILAAASIPAKPSRYPDPPATTYAVYFDEVITDGPDNCNSIFTHDITVELYEAVQDAASEAALEAELNARGIPWMKQSRYWLSNIQRYQVVYEFTYISKT